MIDMQSRTRADDNPEGLPACPACGAAAAPPFVRLAGLPVHGTAVFPTAEQARAVAVGDQELTLCGSCGVVFNSAFDAALLDYTGEHEESQHLSPRFAEYAAGLAAEWVERHRLRDTHVVEVGCGSGHFAAELLDAGAGGVTGIDPHFGPDRVPPHLAHRLRAVPAFFAPELVAPGTAAIVCRHTLEHIPELAAFGTALVEGMRTAGVPVLLAEVPDLGRILAEGAFWNLQYEPCSSFTPATFAGYLDGLGLQVTDVRTTYADQYVVAEAELRADRSPSGRVGTAELDRLHRLCEDFGLHTAARVGYWADWLDARAAAGDAVAVWGGGAKGLTFLNMLAGHTGAVAAVVDINPGLQSNHIGGAGLPIVAPTELKAAPPSAVLLMNPIYRGEVRAQLDALGLSATELIAI
jgi:hypothetical protein